MLWISSQSSIQHRAQQHDDMGSDTFKARASEVIVSEADVLATFCAADILKTGKGRNIKE
jgi:hypothetical protein